MSSSPSKTLRLPSKTTGDLSSKIPPTEKNPSIFLQIVEHPDGTITRPSVPQIPPNNDESIAHAAVRSRDLTINPSTKTSLRLYLPDLPPSSSPTKLPVVLFFHGGGFVLFNASSAPYHFSCEQMARSLPAIVLLLDYRLAPDCRLPAAYDDAVDAILWIRSQAADSSSSSRDPWVTGIRSQSADSSFSCDPWRTGIRSQAADSSSSRDPWLTRIRSQAADSSSSSRDPGLTRIRSQSADSSSSSSSDPWLTGIRSQAANSSSFSISSDPWLTRIRSQAADSSSSSSRDPWLTAHADFDRFFISGSSSGANIAFHAGLRCADIDLNPLTIAGVILNQPYVGGEERTLSEAASEEDAVLPLRANDMMWRLALPLGADRDHEYSNPAVGMTAGTIGRMPARCLVKCRRGDPLIDRQRELVRVMVASGVSVAAQVEDEGCHAFELFDPAAAEGLFGDIKRFVEG